MPKLGLVDLKVQSFVVSMDRLREQKVKGGISIPHPVCLYQSEAPSGNCCPSDIWPCP